MRGWATTTPSGRIRASTSRCRWCRPTGSRPPQPAQGVELWLPPALERRRRPDGGRRRAGRRIADRCRRRVRRSRSTGRCRRRGTCRCAGNQFWLGPARAGQVVRFWVDCDLVHLSIGGHADQVAAVAVQRQRPGPLLAAQGAVPAGPPPLPSRGGPGSRAGRTSSRSSGPCPRRDRVAGQHGRARRGDPRRPPGRDLHRGRAPLLFFDLETRELLRTRPNPLEPGEAALAAASPPGRRRHRGPRPSRSGSNAEPRTPA